MSPAELERLAWLAEECAEVIQAIGKIIRHGYESKDPTNPDHEGNRADLIRELSDVTAAVLLMDREGDITMNEILMKAQARHGKYLHHQGL